MYVLELILHFVPKTSVDAESIADRIISRLLHSNSAVVFATLRVLLYLLNYIEDIEFIKRILRKAIPPLGKEGFLEFSKSNFAY